MTRRQRFLEWPYWLPILGGARGYCAAGRHAIATGAAAFGLYRRNPQAHKYR